MDKKSPTLEARTGPRQKARGAAMVCIRGSMMYSRRCHSLRARQLERKPTAAKAAKVTEKVG